MSVSHEQETETVPVRVLGHLQPDVASVLADSGIPAAELNHLVTQWVARRSLAPAMETAQTPVPPQLARSLQARENWLRGVESEFGTYSRQEIAQLRGAKGTNRSMAGDLKNSGQIITYRRGNSDRIPAFQFTETGGQIRSAMPALIRLARENGWEDLDLLAWLTNPNTYFPEGTRPVDHLDDVELVLAAAADAFEAL